MGQDDYKVFPQNKAEELQLRRWIWYIIIGLLLLIAVSVTHAEDMNANLTSGWLANETRDFVSGNNLTASGTASLLTASTCELYATCKNLSVNDNDYYESLTTAKVVQGGLPRTMACWLKVTQAVGSSNQMAFGYGANTNTANAVFQMGGSTPSVYAWFGGSSDYQVNNAYTPNPMTLYFLIHNGTAQFIYRNTTLLNSTTMPETNPLNTGNTTIRIGTSTWSTTDDFVGLIGNCYLWNYALTQTDINTIYAQELLGFTGQTNWTNLTAPVVYSYKVVTNQTPSDINSATLNITINATITNLTISNITSASYAELYFRPVTTLNNGCAIFYENNCHQQSSIYSVENMTKITNTSYTMFLDDDEIFPAWYPYDFGFIENAPSTANYTVYNAHNIKVNINNFSIVSNYTFLSFEFQTVNGSSPLNVYYCNSSYTSGNPSVSTNCELVTVYSPQSPSHIEHGKPEHTVRFQVNSVKKTTTSYLIIENNGGVPTAWTFPAVTNSSYDNLSFNTGLDTAWSSTNLLFNVQLHSYRDADYFQYYVLFHDSLNNKNTSDVVVDFYNITNYPPTVPDFVNHCGNIYTISSDGLLGDNINPRWSNASDPNNDTVYYNMSVSLGIAPIVLCNHITQTNCSFSDTAIGDGVFSTKISSCDIFGACSNSLDDTCLFTVCKNSYVKSTQPCVTNAKLISYIDSNHCPTMYAVPFDNGTYEYCDVVTINQNRMSDDVKILVVLFVILILGIIGAIFFHEIFFGLSVMAIIMSGITMIYYSYPQILYVATFLSALPFIIVWVLVGVHRRR